ncbi:VanW family protein [Robertmurraya sp. DFI.2.37]|uniref:VanW family protein n=1 Tax=Robertmurraya sp. DFI.2.37 TaxID=3031819 RepID=UPI0012460336|nr:VanW family protein [Robertmurraya sp. DFI.2.37]MDF1509578.1 VanW family protein [Robertmurraya sp. DFI.2.37]
MGKFRWKGLFTVVLMLIVLGGCSKETETVVKKMKTHRVAAAEELNNRLIEKEMQFVIDIIDPSTKEIICTIDPKEMDGNDESFKAELKSWARELARGTESSEGYDQRMVLDKLDENGQIKKGKPMIILEEEELVNRVIEAMDRGGPVELPLKVTESQYSLEEVSQLDEVVIASYTTYFDSGVIGRAKNIELSAAAINNVIFGVGDIFSYNEIVGPRDEASGYQKAMEIVNKELVEGIGGGVCQTSSTLFNAVDQIGVEYIEWHHHSISIGYVPVGRDATVSYGGLDFRFQNPHDVPFLIKAFVDGGSLTVEVRTSEKNAKKLKGE